jgi:microcystin-dependent protein
MANSPIVGSDFSPISWTGDACEQFGELFQTNERLNTFLTWMLNPDGSPSDSFLQSMSDRSAPIGVVQMYVSDTMPSDHWMPCDGRLISRSEYSVLFDRIGTKYGPGNATDFNLPTSEDLYPVGAGGSTTIGGLSGADELLLTHANIPGHFHGFGVSSGNDNLNLASRAWGKASNGTTATVSISGDDVEDTGTAAITAGDLSTTTAIEDTAIPHTPIPIVPKSIGYKFIIKVK